MTTKMLSKYSIVQCLIVLLLAAAGLQTARAVPASPGLHRLYQPGGRFIEARQWGDEWQHGWQTDAGYTIVQDRASGVWFYAEDDGAGGLSPSSVTADQMPPAYMQRAVRPAGGSAQKARALRNERMQKVVPSAGTANIPVILVNFSDTSTTQTKANIDTLLFGEKASDTAGVISGPGSMKEYYDEVSYGKFGISAGPAGVSGWYTASGTHDSYDDAVHAQVGGLVKEAVMLADAGIDYSKYDADGDGKVDVVAIIHQGRGEEESSNAKDIWSHRWTLSASGVGSVTLDGVIINDYIIMPESYGASGAAATIGVITHEYGHALGLPDLYDTDDSSEGIGDWGLMGGGPWNKVSNPGDSPAHMVAWSKYALGWIAPVQIEGKIANQNIPAVDGSATAYLCSENINGVDWVMNTHSGVGEYFLIENRQKSGFDKGLPGTGLLITHIDESVPSDNSANTNENDPLVKVMEADGLDDLYNGTNRGDTGDLFPGSTNNVTFDKDSTPDSLFYDLSESNLSVTDISVTLAVAKATLQCGGADIGFTIDDTGSMAEEIGAVKDGLTGFISYLGKDTSLKPTIVMHTFKDYVELDVLSDDLSVVQDAVNALYPSGGGDCPEYAYSALYQNASALLKGSQILFATDASPNPADPVKMDDLIELLRSRSIRVQTLLTGDCSDGSLPAPAFAPADPVAPGGSENPDGGYNVNAAGLSDASNTVDAFSRIASDTGGTLVLIPEAKDNAAAREVLTNMVTGVMKSSVEPTIVNISPRIVYPGSTLVVQIAGIGTNFTSSSEANFANAVPSLASGITVNSVTPLSSSALKANITVDPAADTTDLRKVGVTTNLGAGTVETAESENVLTISAAPLTPTIIGVDPATIVISDTGADGFSSPEDDVTVNLTIFGLGTGFDGTSTPSFDYGFAGSGITVNSVTATSATEIVANITVAGDAGVGTRDVNVITGAEYASESLVGPLMVTRASAGIARITAVDRTTGSTGRSYTLNLVGMNTSFTDSVTTAAFTGGPVADDPQIMVDTTTVADATHASLTITVDAAAAMGYRDLTLTTAGETATGLDAFLVTSAPPTASFTVSAMPATGTPTSFTDTSVDTDGTIAAWSWDFGDGNSSTAQNPKHTYVAGGEYTVQLTVTDNDGMTDTASGNITVQGVPVAGFMVSSTPMAGETVNFTDTSTDSDGSIVAWSWVFGDGYNSSLQNPVHTFTAAGVYQVQLTVTDNDGLINTVSRSVAVLVGPQASFTASASPTAGVAVSFTDTSTDADGSISTRSWDFGDGTSSTARNPGHTFSTSDTYMVSLTVTDNDGLADETSMSMKVAAPPSTDSGGSLGLADLLLLLGFGFTQVFRRRRQD